MDNPWGNAWEEPATDHKNLPTWTHTTIHTDDSDGDIGITTSWSAVSGIKWGEDEHASRNSNLWTESNESLQVWSSQYEHSPPGKSSTVVEPPQISANEQNDTTPPVPVPVHIAKESSPSPKSDDKENTQLPSPTLSLPPRTGISSSSPPPSPDPFGGFETGQLASTDTSEPELWTSATYPPAGDVGAWGSTAWGDVEPNEEQKDGWEAASTKQEKEDHQHSELLASILSQWGELVAQAWHETGPQNEEPAWMSQAVNGIQDLECFKLALEKLTPPPGMVLPPATQLSNSHVRRKMVEALKSTRNLPFTKDSPMAFFLASKGSLAWEATIKSKKDIVDDGSNLLPAGWKIVDKDRGRDTAHAIQDVNKGRKSSGLLSFWGRRVSKPPEVEEELNPSPATSRPSTPKVAADVAAPMPNKEATPKPPPECSPSPSSLAAFKSTPNPPQDPKSKSSSPLPDPSATPAAVNKTIDANPQLDAKPSTSTVSRWFSRFSTKGSTAPRDSLAFSSGDLEFLSDIRSAADEPEQARKDLQVLDSNESKASFTKLSSEPVPPLPPPKILGNAMTTASSGDIFDLFGWNGSSTTASSSEPPPIDESLSSFSPPKDTPPPNGSTQKQGSFFLNVPLEPPTPSTPSTGRSSAFGPNKTPQSRSRTPIAIMSDSTEPHSSYNDKLLSQFALPPPPPTSATHTSSSGLGSRTSQEKATPHLAFRTSPSFKPPPTPPSIPRQNTPTTTAIAVTDPTHLVPPNIASSPLDGDEFSDFQSSLALPMYTASSPLPSASHVKQPLFEAGAESLFDTTSSSFDDFDEFVSSPLHSPPPPQPPAKSPRLTLKSPPPPPVLPKSLPRQRGWISDNNGLVSTPSLQPGARAVSTEIQYSKQRIVDPFEVDFFAESQPSVNHNASTKTSEPNAFTLPPPPKFSLSLSPSNQSKVPNSILNDPLSGDIGVPVGPSPPPQLAPSVAMSETKGGLSAQDLLFFEGT